MRVSVVIPTWMRPLWLERCLQALEAQDRVPDEVIVVGRAEDEATRNLVLRGRDRSSLRLRWVQVDRAGHVAPLQRGLEEVHTEVVAFLDDDAEPEPDWLERLVAPLADPAIGTVGGRVIDAAGDASVRVSPRSGGIRWYGRHVGNVSSRADPELVTVEAVRECNWAWRCQVLRGLRFDPVLDFDDASMYGLDLSLQAKARGYRTVYESRAAVLHHDAPRDPELDRADRVRRCLTYSRNYTYIGMKHFRGFRRAAFLAWWWLIGDRGSYGLLTSVVDMVTRPGAVRGMMQASFRGKREGLRLWAGR
jgi:GT2 family glycosyltransferase